MATYTSEASCFIECSQKAAKAIALRIKTAHEDPENPLNCESEVVDYGIWLGGDNFDGEAVAYEIHKWLKETDDTPDCVSYEMSFGCSRPVEDAFGGMAYFVTENKVKEMSTGSWVADCHKEFAKGK